MLQYRYAGYFLGFIKSLNIYYNNILKIGKYSLTRFIIHNTYKIIS